ncbi:MAG: hypothetical protein AAFY35_13565 [Pseudomonadota bacterium]
MAQKTGHRPKPHENSARPANDVKTSNPDRVTIHPAAAPLGTDDEAGRAAPPPLPGADPAAIYTVDTKGDVRADANDRVAKSAPRVRENPSDKPKRSPKALMVAAIAVACVIAVIFAAGVL